MSIPQCCDRPDVYFITDDEWHTCGCLCHAFREKDYEELEHLADMAEVERTWGER